MFRKLRKNNLVSDKKIADIAPWFGNQSQCFCLHKNKVVLFFQGWEAPVIYVCAWRSCIIGKARQITCELLVYMKRL